MSFALTNHSTDVNITITATIITTTTYNSHHVDHPDHDTRKDHRDPTVALYTDCSLTTNILPLAVRAAESSSTTRELHTHTHILNDTRHITLRTIHLLARRIVLHECAASSSSTVKAAESS